MFYYMMVALTLAADCLRRSEPTSIRALVCLCGPTVRRAFITKVWSYFCHFALHSLRSWALPVQQPIFGMSHRAVGFTTPIPTGHFHSCYFNARWITGSSHTLSAPFILQHRDDAFAIISWLSFMAPTEVTANYQTFNIRGDGKSCPFCIVCVTHDLSHRKESQTAGKLKS